MSLSSMYNMRCCPLSFFFVIRLTYSFRFTKMLFLADNYGYSSSFRGDSIFWKELLHASQRGCSRNAALWIVGQVLIAAQKDHDVFCDCTLSQQTTIEHKLLKLRRQITWVRDISFECCAASYSNNDRKLVLCIMLDPRTLHELLISS